MFSSGMESPMVPIPMNRLDADDNDDDADNDGQNVRKGNCVEPCESNLSVVTSGIAILSPPYMPSLWGFPLDCLLA